MDEKIRKEIMLVKILSLFEGIFFFTAGICALLAGNILGYISGVFLVILGCGSIYPVFTGGDEHWANLGASLSNDESVDEYGERVEEEKRA